MQAMRCLAQQENINMHPNPVVRRRRLEPNNHYALPASKQCGTIVRCPAGRAFTMCRTTEDSLHAVRKLLPGADEWCGSYPTVRSRHNQQLASVSYATLPHVQSRTQTMTSSFARLSPHAIPSIAHDARGRPCPQTTELKLPPARRPTMARSVASQAGALPTLWAHIRCP